jgi:hypothetical protein
MSFIVQAPGILNKDPTVWLDGARPSPVSFIGRALAVV